ncbi:hypothetical protein BJX66DRAFT_109274 [Aspergillus keveii]|uniref:Uncharacterized protein n=1 Tax=Aspergillus keveii TaxID=714993 RepID=A0ABR4FL59_9EURO
MDSPSHEVSNDDDIISRVKQESETKSPEICDVQVHREVSNPPGPTSPTEIFLNFSPSYVKDWNTTAAFRELYQNWKDAIIETFRLDPAAFRPVYKENETQVYVTVPKPRSRTEALGFITYEKASGKLTLTNACARLTPDLLQLGQTSKQGKGQLAGCHGEGLKLAAMVMTREKYRVSIQTDGSHWDFSLAEPSRFCCVISSADEVWPNKKTNSGRDMASCISRTWRDVSVMIYPGQQSCQVDTFEMFRKWLGVTLEIRGFSYPESIIETDHGGLILDPGFRGKLFLKGLLLPACALETRPFQFGYNFVHGEVNRDRQRLVNLYEEADLVRKIWESAIKQNQALILPVYVNLLRECPRAPDVEMADQLLEKPTRVLIWEHLLKEADGRRFYFCRLRDSKSIGTITGALRKEPVGLPEGLWNLLRGVVPIRTANEEHAELFRNAAVSEPPDTIFANHVLRAFKASLAGCHYDSNLEISRGDYAYPAMLIDSQRCTLILNDKWLDIKSVPGMALLLQL